MINFIYIESDEPTLEDDIVEAEGTNYHIQISFGDYVVNESFDTDNDDTFSIMTHGVFPTLQAAKDFIVSRH